MCNMKNMLTTTAIVALAAVPEWARWQKKLEKTAMDRALRYVVCSAWKGNCQT